MASHDEAIDEQLSFHDAEREERLIEAMIHLIEMYQMIQEFITANNDRPQLPPDDLTMHVIAILANIIADEEEIDWDDDAECWGVALRLAEALFFTGEYYS
ncbi:hypothetical protein PENSTE_c003G03924 [Penicillium steckii]|uniref:Uncharacterized protein n=1 Tax=Penicillium steckii TaxID=303698 RepID=A0A1V6TRT1_9EURO|nr:hypothetical protein PENSTE_c003G03924 [Penicillium steckii]